jgi:hypothetical protein
MARTTPIGSSSPFSPIRLGTCVRRMAHPTYLREKARKLRTTKRLTLIEIAERLALPKTTVYYWIKDLPDPEIKYRDTPARIAARKRQGRRIKHEYARRRKAAYDQGWQEYPALIQEPTFRDFICIYIGEGYKRSRHTVAVANSDLRVVRLANHWIRRIARNKVTYQFQYHADQDPEYLIEFWSRGLGVDAELFTYQRKSNSGQLAGRTWRSKHGVLTVRAQDTMFRYRLQAWIDRTEDSWLDSLIPGCSSAW